MDIQSCLKVLTKSELQKIATKCKVSCKSSWRKSSFVSALEKEDLDDLVQAMTSAQLTSILSENSLSSSGKVADKRERLKTALDGGGSSSKKKKTAKKTAAKKSSSKKTAAKKNTKRKKTKVPKKKPAAAGLRVTRKRPAAAAVEPPAPVAAACNSRAARPRSPARPRPRFGCFPA